MKIVNASPDFLTFAWVVHGLPPRLVSDEGGLTACFCIKGTFLLRHEGVAEKFPDGPDHPGGDEMVDGDAALGMGRASDFVPFKPAADFAVSGTAYPDTPESSCFPVVARVGELRKELVIYGPREWTNGVFAARAGEPGVSGPLKLSYAHAWGGPESPRNPIGTGAMTQEAHRIELRGRVIDRRGGDAEPAGFLPISPDWPQRRGKLGTYDDDWVAGGWPWFPRDFDWTYFQAAPVDQWFPGYLKGDEQIRLTNLNAKVPVYETSLPGQRARCFVTRKGPDGRDVFFEVPVVLDTVWIDADKEKLVLTWRGHTATGTIKVPDLLSVFVFLEPLGSPQLGIEAYRDRFVAELAKGKPVPPPTVAVPTREEIQATIAARLAEGEALKKQLESEMLAKQNEVLDGFREQVNNSIALMETSPWDVKEPLERLRGALGVIDAGKPLDAPANAAQLLETKKWLDESIRMFQMEKVDRAQLAKLSEAGAMITEAAHRAEKDMATMEAFDAKAAEFEASVMAKIPDAVKRRPPPKDKPIDPASARRDGLNDLPMAEYDFSGLDLRGVNFGRSNLREAKFVGAKLNGADLTGAILAGADLSHAVLDGAQLGGADLTGARTAGVVWKNTRIARARLVGLDLVGADFSGATGEGVAFARSNLGGAVFRGAVLPRARFGGAFLEAVDFADAVLDNADFAGVKGSRAKFLRASLVGARFPRGADFSRAIFVESRAGGSNWSGSCFDGADLSRAQLRRAKFSSASLVGVVMDRCDAADTDFEDAKLNDARLTHANLLRAHFDRADLTGAVLDGSNLYDACFWETVVEDASWDQANIRRTRLELK